jgi:hypothetical protein
MSEEEAGSAAGYFSREGLLEAYAAMKAALSEGKGPRARADWNWLEARFDISPWCAEISARIFTELGLLRELTAPPWLEIARQQSRADLSASLLYRRITEKSKEA